MNKINNISKSIKKVIGAVCLSTVFIGGASADVMMHAFNWNYAEVASKAEEISDLGYSSVLVSPPYLSNNSTAWWARYQPVDYRILMSPLGNKKDFENMIKQLSDQGVNLYVDVIFNHMANTGQNKGQEKYPNMDVSGQEFEDNKLYGNLSVGLFDSSDFHDGGGAKCISNYFCRCKI